MDLRCSLWVAGLGVFRHGHEYGDQFVGLAKEPAEKIGCNPIVFLQKLQPARFFGSAQYSLAMAEAYALVRCLNCSFRSAVICLLPPLRFQVSGACVPGLSRGFIPLFRYFQMMSPAHKRAQKSFQGRIVIMPCWRGTGSLQTTMHCRGA